MNTITVCGNLTADPELKNLNGYSCLTFTVAERSVSKDAEGNYIPNYFDVTAWRNLADRASTWFHKGDKVCVSGSVTIRRYKTKDGKDGCSVQIRADNIEGMARRQNQDSNSSGGQAYSNEASPRTAAASPQNNGFTQVVDDDLPF